MVAVGQSIVRRIEAMEGLDEVAGTLAKKVGELTHETSVKNALSGTWLGHPVHPMLTDLPIGAWTMAAALDVLGGRRGASSARRLVGLGVLAAIPTAAAGASDWSDTYGPDQRVGLVHAAGNTAGVVLQTMSFLARRKGKRFSGMALSSLGLGAMLASAYLGGHLSFNRGVGVSHTAFEEPVTEWTDVAAEDDVAAEAQPLRVSANGVPVVLVRCADGIHALSATCVHAGGPLDEGEVVDCTIRCPWHGSVFQLADGAALRGPAATTQPAWDVRVEEGRIQVRASSDPQ
jgi:nitrite reductase/ring-hydroxylating ferredoxin subunit/uncharacterized membrane protein